MKLAELCTAYPSEWNAPPVRNPGRALPKALRMKLRMQRGWLQASLDSHAQRSAQRSGLGLRPYLPGDSLRAVSTRHLMLQDELLVRTDVSPGRFHVSILVHCYENMSFASLPGAATKMQTAWAMAGLLQNIHEQQAQKIDLIALKGASLGEEILKQSARLKRSHFCYIISDLLFDPASKDAAIETLTNTLKHLRIPRGLVLVVRDPLESPDYLASRVFTESDTKTIALAPPDHPQRTTADAKQAPEFNSGDHYLENLRAQLGKLETDLNRRGWSSQWLTPEFELQRVVQNLSARLSALRIGP